MLLLILFSSCCKHNLFVGIDVMMQTMLFSELPHVHRCYSTGHYNPCCTDVIVQGHYLFISALQWIVTTHPTGVAGVFPNVSVQCGIVNSDVYGLLYCSCHVVFFPAYYFKVLHRCHVASDVLVFMYWGWCF